MQQRAVTIYEITILSGERRRERVVTFEEEEAYLAGANFLLSSVAAILVDTGLRPDECRRLVWENINWANGRNETSHLVGAGPLAAISGS